MTQSPSKQDTMTEQVETKKAMLAYGMLVLYICLNSHSSRSPFTARRVLFTLLQSVSGSSLVALQLCARIWDPRDNSLECTLLGHDDHISSLDFSSTGNI